MQPRVVALQRLEAAAALVGLLDGGAALLGGGVDLALQPRRLRREPHHLGLHRVALLVRLPQLGAERLGDGGGALRRVPLRGADHLLQHLVLALGDERILPQLRLRRRRHRLLGRRRLARLAQLGGEARRARLRLGALVAAAREVALEHLGALLAAAQLGLEPLDAVDGELLGAVELDHLLAQVVRLALRLRRARLGVHPLLLLALQRLLEAAPHVLHRGGLLGVDGRAALHLHLELAHVEVGRLGALVLRRHRRADRLHALRLPVLVGRLARLLRRHELRLERLDAPLGQRVLPRLLVARNAQRLGAARRLAHRALRLRLRPRLGVALRLVELGLQRAPLALLVGEPRRELLHLRARARHRRRALLALGLPQLSRLLRDTKPLPQRGAVRRDLVELGARGGVGGVGDLELCLAPAQLFLGLGGALRLPLHLVVQRLRRRLELGAARARLLLDRLLRLRQPPLQRLAVARRLLRHPRAHRVALARRLDRARLALRLRLAQPLLGLVELELQRALPLARRLPRRLGRLPLVERRRSHPLHRRGDVGRVDALHAHVDDGLRALRPHQRREALGRVDAAHRDGVDHDGVRVAAEALLEQLRQLRVAVRDVAAAPLRERRDHVAERRERPVDVDHLLHQARVLVGARRLGALRARQVDQVELRAQLARLRRQQRLEALVVRLAEGAAAAVAHAHPQAAAGTTAGTAAGTAAALAVAVVVARVPASHRPRAVAALVAALVALGPRLHDTRAVGAARRRPRRLLVLVLRRDARRHAHLLLHQQREDGVRARRRRVHLGRRRGARVAAARQQLLDVLGAVHLVLRQPLHEDAALRRAADLELGRRRALLRQHVVQRLVVHLQVRHRRPELARRAPLRGGRLQRGHPIEEEPAHARRQAGLIVRAHHRVRLARAGLAVGEARRVEALEELLDERRAARGEYADLVGLGAEGVVEREDVRVVVLPGEQAHRLVAHVHDRRLAGGPLGGAHRAAPQRHLDVALPEAAVAHHGVARTAWLAALPAARVTSRAHAHLIRALVGWALVPRPARGGRRLAAVAKVGRALAAPRVGRGADSSHGRRVVRHLLPVLAARSASRWLAQPAAVGRGRGRHGAALALRIAAR